MPLYEYKCLNCGVFEELQSIHDEPIKMCPKCQSDVQKQMSVPGDPSFRGRGFYETDYKKKIRKEE